MRVLLVDMGAYGQAMSTILKKLGVGAVSAPVDDAIDMVVVYEYDAVVLGPKAFNLIPQLRQRARRSIVIVGVGQDDVHVRVKGMTMGADDVWTSTIDPQEASARLEAYVRRASGNSESTMTVGSVSVNFENQTAEANGNRIHLTGKEYQMLELFCRKPNTVIRKEEFLNHLYGGMDEPELKIVDVFITKLRKKIWAATGGEDPIKTEWGRGYTLAVNPT